MSKEDTISAPDPVDAPSPAPAPAEKEVDREHETIFKSWGAPEARDKPGEFLFINLRSDSDNMDSGPCTPRHDQRPPIGLACSGQDSHLYTRRSHREHPPLAVRQRARALRRVQDPDGRLPAWLWPFRSADNPFSKILLSRRRGDRRGLIIQWNTVQALRRARHGEFSA